MKLLCCLGGHNGKKQVNSVGNNNDSRVDPQWNGRSSEAASSGAIVAEQGNAQVRNTQQQAGAGIRNPSYRQSIVGHAAGNVNNTFSPSLMLTSSPSQRRGSTSVGAKVKSSVVEACNQVLSMLEQAMLSVNEAVSRNGEIAVTSGGDSSAGSYEVTSPTSKKKAHGKNLWSSLKTALLGKESQDQRTIIEKIYTRSCNAVILLDVILSQGNEGASSLLELGQDICTIAQDALVLFQNAKVSGQSSLQEYMSSRIQVALQSASQFVTSLKVCHAKSLPDPKAGCRDQVQALQRALESIANSASELYYHIDMEPSEFFYLLACDIEKKLAMLNQFSIEEEEACKGRYMAFGNQIHFAGRQVTKILRDLILASPEDKAFVEISKRLAFSCNEIIDYVRRAISSVNEPAFQQELQVHVEEMMLATIVLFNTLAHSTENTTEEEKLTEESPPVAGEMREVSIDGDSDAAQMIGSEATFRIRVDKHIRIVFVACANLMRKAKQGMTSLVACESNIVILGDAINVIDSELLIAKDGGLVPKPKETNDFSYYAHTTKSTLGNASNLTSSIGELVGSDTNQPLLTSTILDLCTGIVNLQEALCAAARSLKPKNQASQLELLTGLKKLVESFISFMKSTYSVIRRLGVSQSPSKSFASWISQQFGLLSHVSSIIDQIRRELGPFPSDFSRPIVNSMPRNEASLTGASILSNIPPILERMTLKAPGSGPFKLSSLTQRKLVPKVGVVTPAVAADGLLKALGTSDDKLRAAVIMLKDVFTLCKDAYELAKKSSSQRQNLPLVQTLEQKTDAILYRVVEKIHDHIRLKESNIDADENAGDDTSYVLQLISDVEIDTSLIAKKIKEFSACDSTANSQDVAAGVVVAAAANESKVPVATDLESKISANNLSEPAIPVSASQNIEPREQPLSESIESDKSPVSADDAILRELAVNLERQISSMAAALASSSSNNNTVDASALKSAPADAKNISVALTLTKASANKGSNNGSEFNMEVLNDTVNASSFQRQLQTSTKAIATACLAVFKALTKAQREASNGGVEQRGEKGYFVKLAADLASKVALLGTHVSGYCQNKEGVTIELLRVSTRAIIQHCVQVMTATSARTDVLSAETVILCKDASKNVTVIVERLVKVIDDATKQLDVDEGGEDMKELMAVMKKKHTGAGAIAQELEAQAEILKMEKELMKARSRLTNLRKQNKNEPI